MKKIIHIFTISSSIVFLEGFFDKLKNRGYDLIVISSDGEEARYQERLGNIKFYPVSMKRGISPLKDLISLIKIIIIILKERPYAIHAHTPKGGFLAMVAGKITSVKYRFFHLHGLKYPGENGIRRKIIKYMEKTTIKLATDVFSVSFSLREYVIKEKLAIDDKIKIIYNGSVKGIDAKKSKQIRLQKSRYREELDIRENDCVIGFVGRITEEKGIFELIEAYKKLLLSNYNIKMIICGRNEIKNKDNCEKFLNFISIDSVKYFGHVDNPLEYMACCDIFVLPSWREGFGLVNIEANSVGVPVITTNIVGCKDSIENNVTGILVPPKNVKDLYKAIELLLLNPDIRKNMGKRGIERVEKLYDREKIWDKLIDEYDNKN